MQQPGTSRLQLPCPLLKFKNQLFLPFLTIFGRFSCVFVKRGTYDKKLTLSFLKHEKMTYF